MNTQSTWPELARGKAAFDRIVSRLGSLDDEELAATNTNMAEAAIAALGVAGKVREAELYARFQSLPAAEFDIGQVDALADAAWATLYAAAATDQARHGRSRARLPALLVEEAQAIEARMQIVCEYHLADVSSAQAELARLRSGQGYRDLANDLLGYAALYRAHQELLQRDPKHYRATDVDDAVRVAEQMLTILGESVTAEQQAAGAQLGRVWTVLVQAYDEISAAGRWLLRHDRKRAELVFPSLFAMGRSGRPRRGQDSTPESGADSPASA